jgi:hypothetical protein
MLLKIPSGEYKLLISGPEIEIQMDVKIQRIIE